MLYAGSDDGVYRIDGIQGGPTETTQVLESGRVYRVRRLDGLPGLFVAATEDVYYSPDGEDWTALGVPTDADVNAVGATPDGEVLFAGTYPAHVYAFEGFDPASVGGGSTDEAVDEAESTGWTELEGFLELPAREDWGLPRHDFQAHVRSIHSHPDAPDRVAVGVEVGGVHVSGDRGETWSERRDGTHDDVHHLAVGGPETFVTATGKGLFRSDDAGRSWTRLDADHEPEYFRESLVHDGDVYAGAAHGPSPTWPDDDDPALFVSRDGGPLERVDSPVPEEVVIGWTVAEGDVVGATYAGTLLRETPDGFEVVGEVPTPGDVRGRYLQLAWLPE